jgi:hypothetical protein
MKEKEKCIACWRPIKEKNKLIVVDDLNAKQEVFCSYTCIAKRYYDKYILDKDV